MKLYKALVAMILFSTIGIKADLQDDLYAAIEQLDVRKVERLTQRLDSDDPELLKLIKFSQAYVEEQKQNLSLFKSWRDLTKAMGGGTLIAGAIAIELAASKIRKIPVQQNASFSDVPMLRQCENWFNRLSGQQTASEQRIEALLDRLITLLRHKYSSYTAIGLGVAGGYFFIKGLFMTHARDRIKRACEIEAYLKTLVREEAL